MADEQSEHPWRQGHVLDSNDIQRLKLIEAGSNDDPIVLVISHDCDLAASDQKEPRCEIVVGSIVEQIDGRFARGKSPRKLSLTFTGGAIAITAEFLATDKRTIPKSELLKGAPSTQVALTRDEFTWLQRWLAARYRRPSFPTQFDARLSYDKADRKFAKIIEKSALGIHAVLADIDEGAEIDRTDPNDTYSLTIYLIYEVEKDPEASEIAAGKASNKITKLFRKHFFIEGKWQNIELVECVVRSENEISVYEARMLREWQFEYLSPTEEETKAD